MTWTKVADEHIDRTWDLSDSAFRLDMAGRIFSNRTLSDGFVPANRAASLTPTGARSRAVRELVAAGLWRESPGGWTIVGFLADQPSREEVEAQRAYDAVRQRKRMRKGDASLLAEEDAARRALFDARDRRRSRAISQCESPSESPSESQRPGPSRPVPTRNNEVEDGSGGPMKAAEPVVVECAICEKPITGTFAHDHIDGLFVNVHPDCKARRSKPPATTTSAPSDAVVTVETTIPTCATCGHPKVRAGNGVFVCTNAPGHPRAAGMLASESGQ